MFRVLRSLLIILVSLFLFSGQVFLHVQAEETAAPAEITAAFHSVTTGSTISIKVPFSDEWFLKPATQYNHSLARSSMGLTVASFRPSSSDEINAYDEHAQDFLSQAGFTDFSSYDYDRPAGRYTIANCFGRRTITDEHGETFDLIAVGIAGQGYKDEWLSNLSVGNSTVHTGFSEAAVEVYDRLFGYISRMHIKRPFKIWITGFSRAAAIANILAAYLENDDILPEEDVYVYTFATPATTKDPEAGSHDNIFNIVGSTDLVPTIPFSDWGYDRYGNTRFLPSQESSSIWFRQHAKAEEVYETLVHLQLWNNPEINAQLKFATACLLEICPDSETFTAHLQNKLLSLWSSHSIPEVLHALIEIAEDPELITPENEETANCLLDFAQDTLVDYMLRSDTIGYYESRTTIGANIMHEHTPEVYIAWMFSEDDPNVLLADSFRFRRMIIDTLADAEIRDPETKEIIQTIDSRGNEVLFSDDICLFVSQAKGTMTLTLPGDRDYEVVLKPRMNSKFDVISTDYLNTQTSMFGYSKETYDGIAGKPITIAVNNEDVGAVMSGSIHSLDFAKGQTGNALRSIQIARNLHQFHLSWKNMVVLSIGVFTMIVALLLGANVYAIGNLQFQRRRKRGWYAENEQYRFLPILAISMIPALFICSQFMKVLFPEDNILRYVVKGVLGLLLIYVCWTGTKHNPWILNRCTLYAMILFTVHDLLVGISPEAGYVIRILGGIVMCIGFWRSRKPLPWQLALFAVFAVQSFTFMKDGYVPLTAINVLIYLCWLTSVLMLCLAMSGAGRFTIGSVFFFIASFSLSIERLGNPGFSLHFFFALSYYLAMIFFAAGTIQLRTLLRRVTVTVPVEKDTVEEVIIAP